MDRFNKEMKTALEKIDEYRDMINYNRILKIVKAEFYEVEGCILRKKEKKINKLSIGKIIRVYGNRTGYEASYNEIRINDYVEEFKNGPIEGLALTLRIARDWENQLIRDFPNYTFHIVIGYDDEFTTLRFYKFREEEGSWIAIDNLEGYVSEAVMVIVS